MSTTKDIQLDVWQDNHITVHAMQNEVSGRFLKIKLTDQMALFDVSAYNVAFYMEKPDGKVIFNGCSKNDANTITVGLTSQMSAVAGEIKNCELHLYNKSETLKVKGLKLVIAHTCDDGKAIESKNEFTALIEALNKADQSLEYVTEFLKQKQVEIDNIVGTKMQSVDDQMTTINSNADAAVTKLNSDGGQAIQDIKDKFDQDSQNIYSPAITQAVTTAKVATDSANTAATSANTATTKLEADGNVAITKLETDGNTTIKKIETHGNTALQSLHDSWLTWFNSFKGTSQSQLETDFNAWFESIKGHLSEDVAGNLLNLINTKLDKDLFNQPNGVAGLDANGKLKQMPTVTDIGAVPTSRKVNGHPLSSDIDLSDDLIGRKGKDASGAVVVGAEVFNDYSANTSSGSCSHAEGYSTKAAGDYSHAEGKVTTASGSCSHAEGYTTTASATCSHAEGHTTTASGSCSHAEGYSTTASGSCSHAEGYSTKAAGDYSHAEGWSTAYGSYSHAEGRTSASGSCSHAEGSATIASGQYSHAEGNGTKASEDCSHAEGKVTTAAGYYSHAEGSYTTASATSSHAEGSSTTASATCSHAEGYSTTASGQYSHAEGCATIASGDYSHAEGWSTIANGCQTVIGCHNVSKSGFDISTKSGNLFIIGNGVNTDRRNAFRVDGSGRVYSTGSYSATGADYAEYFEWIDKNSINEDRRGLFVTLQGEKIKLATSGDYILGVISANPCILGNTYDDQWKGMYLTDIFGDIITHEVHHEAYTDEFGIEHEECTKKECALNPNYKSDEAYIPRSERPEWDPVGLFGQLVVIDDGTCEADGYCKVTDKSTVTKSETGYRVLARLDDKHIRILVK